MLNTTMLDTMRVQVTRRPMEHRWGERVELDVPVQLVLAAGTTVPGRLRNASVSGALIETRANCPVFTTLHVKIGHGAGDGRELELPGCVMRAERGIIGVEWRDMATPTLIALLHEAGGDQERLCRRC